MAHFLDHSSRLDRRWNRMVYSQAELFPFAQDEKVVNFPENMTFCWWPSDTTLDFSKLLFVAGLMDWAVQSSELPMWGFVLISAQ